MHVGENLFPEDGFLFKIFRKVAETGDSAHIKYSFHGRMHRQAARAFRYWNSVCRANGNYEPAENGYLRISRKPL